MTRDTVDYLSPERYRLVGYVARQSWATIARPPGPVVDVGGLESTFQRRVVAGALAGDALRQLESVGAVDLVLLDLVDERLGLHELPGGGLVTRSVELVGSGLEAAYSERSRHIPFGSRTHLAAWREGADIVLATLRRLGLLHRTLVLAPRWASTSVQGDRRLRSVGMTPQSFALRARPYYRLLAAELGADRLLGRTTPATADAHHQWGLAPFHYAEPVYRALVGQVEEATNRLGRLQPHRG